MKSLVTVGAALLLALTSLCSRAADPVPVIEISPPPVAPGAAGQPSPARRGAGVSVQNELLLTLQQMQDEIRALRGALEAQQHKLERLERLQRERYRDMDRRLGLLISTLPEGAAPASPQASPQGEAGAPAAVPERTDAAAGADTTAGADATDSAAMSDGAAYDNAYRYVREREFVQAEEALAQFLTRYPDSALLPNAWYWIGEVKLALGKEEAATDAFNQVISRFPTHPKAADALYKLGLLAQRGGDGALARRLMQQLQEQFPQSSAAGLARSFLSNQP
jgi:tol-pal system protein YbgF